MNFADYSATEHSKKKVCLDHAHVLLSKFCSSKKKIFQNNHNSMYVRMTKIRHAILCVKPFMKKNQTSTGKYNGFVIKCCDTNGDLKRRILVQVHLERKF